ncbi:hypothetical protein RJT34_17326 [Clitoria ternatea]|uniref:Uncharacterized protein n=1 Tax=Clitoria ternatea TaxID=43366 RepID=A0AAN9PER1_CLITE
MSHMVMVMSNVKPRVMAYLEKATARLGHFPFVSSCFSPPYLNYGHGKSKSSVVRREYIHGGVIAICKYRDSYRRGIAQLLPIAKSRTHFSELGGKQFVIISLHSILLLDALILIVRFQCGKLFDGSLAEGVLLGDDLASQKITTITRNKGKRGEMNVNADLTIESSEAGSSTPTVSKGTDLNTTLGKRTYSDPSVLAELQSTKCNDMNLSLLVRYVHAWSCPLFAHVLGEILTTDYFTTGMMLLRTDFRN